MNYQHLTVNERYQIQALHRVGFTHAAIAAQIDRAASTVGCGLKRSDENIFHGVKMPHAKLQADDVQPRPSQVLRPRGWAAVEAYLPDEHSPQAISGCLPVLGQPTVSHEQIYQHIVVDRKAGCGPSCVVATVTHAGIVYPGQGRFRDGPPLSERPAETATRQTLVNWEAVSRKRPTKTASV